MHLPRRPSPAMVVAFVALTVALGGVSYAATTLVPRHSVGAEQLRRGAVSAPKLRTGAVGSRAVHDASLLRRDFKKGQIPNGPKGDPGTPGQKGDPGTPASQEWGWIRGTGSIGASQGVTGVTHPSAGNYIVSFDRTVNQACAPVVTANSLSSFETSWTYAGDNEIGVHIFNSADTATDNNFSIVLGCPPS